MRKIETLEDREKRDKRNKIIIGVILVALMLLSTAGYALLNTEQPEETLKLKYNGREFVSQSGYWMTLYQGKTLYFNYLPNETSSFQTRRSIGDYSGQTIYFENIGSEESRIIDILEQFGVKFQRACLDENCTENFPIKDCSSNLIIIKPGNEELKEEDNCVYLISNESAKAVDSWLYGLAGV